MATDASSAARSFAAGIASEAGLPLAPAVPGQAVTAATAAAAAGSADWRDLAVAIVALFEGCAERGHDGLIRPYLDRYAKPNVWTRGYGRTYGIASDSPAQTVDQCKAELRVGLDAYALKILKLAPILAQRPACLAAVVSWSWNCGVGAFQHSRLRAAINQGHWPEANEFIRKPRTAGGVELRGLARRRDAEAALFAKGL